MMDYLLLFYLIIFQVACLYSNEKERKGMDLGV